MGTTVALTFAVFCVATPIVVAYLLFEDWSRGDRVSLLRKDKLDRDQAVGRLLRSLANHGEQAVSALIRASRASSESRRETALEAAQEQIHLFECGLSLYDRERRETLGLERDVTFNDLSDAQASMALLALYEIISLQLAIGEMKEKRALDNRAGLTRQFLQDLRKSRAL